VAGTGLSVIGACPWVPQARVTIMHTLETQLELRKQALADIRK